MARGFAAFDELSGRLSPSDCRAIIQAAKDVQCIVLHAGRHTGQKLAASAAIAPTQEHDVREATASSSRPLAACRAAAAATGPMVQHDGRQRQAGSRYEFHTSKPGSNQRKPDLLPETEPLLIQGRYGALNPNPTSLTRECTWEGGND